MEIITYGVERLVDWVARLKAGRATVTVHFTGGALTSLGVTPAEYTTSHPFMQKVIEGSAEFKSGRIKVIRRRKVPELMSMAMDKRGGIRPSSPVQPVASAERKPTTQAANELSTDTEEERDSDTTEEERGSEIAEEETGLVVVEVSCLQDAQGYLQEKFGIPTYKVRSYEAAQQAASEHGVKFTGSKFE